jgi:acetoacetyl-CoA synthetase
MFPPPKFFPTARLNFAEIIFRAASKNDVVIHFVREGVEGVEEVSCVELKERTRQMNDAVVSSGVTEGDRVAAVISNSVSSITLCLATLVVGAIWSSTSCDAGVAAIVSRYEQIKPKIVFADNAYIYAGKLIKLQDRTVEWSRILGKDHGLRDAVILQYCNVDFDVSKVPHGITMESFLARGTGRAFQTKSLPFTQPAFILFSSGTVR